MPAQQQAITLYTAKVCPYAHRSELALEEAGAKYTAYKIDLQNKPVWYVPKVNPASKVPAIAYGGPEVPAHEPSPESVKIAESLVIVEFVADLFPESDLLPKDPVARAQARFFIEVVSSKFVPGFGAVHTTGNFEGLWKGVEAIQELLSTTKGKFALGDHFTIADIALAPFIARLDLLLRIDQGPFAAGEGATSLETLKTNYTRFWTYWKDVKARPSFKATWDEEYMFGAFERYLASQKAAAAEKK